MHQVVIRACEFNDTVVLTDLQNAPAIVFMDCVFHNGISARDATIERSLELVRCEIGVMDGPQSEIDCTGSEDIAIDLENAVIDGDLELFDCQMGGRIFAPSLRSKSDVRIRGCRVAPALDRIGRRLRFDEIGEKFVDDVMRDRLAWSLDTFDRVPAISLDGARIEGDLEVTSATDERRRTSRAIDTIIEAGELDPQMAVASVVMGDVSARGIEVGGDVTLFGLMCYGGGLDFEGAHVRGSLSVVPQTTHLVDGPAFRTFFVAPLHRQRRNGRVILTGATIDANLDLTIAEIGGSADLSSIRVGGMAAMAGLMVGAQDVPGDPGDLNMAFARVRGFLHAKRSKVLPLSFRRHTLSVRGSLDLSGCDIQFVEVGGAWIGGEIRIITGEFRRLYFTMGMTLVDGDTEKRWPQPCVAHSVHMLALNVKENLDVSGIQSLEKTDFTRYRSTGFSKHRGFVLRQSRIGGNVTFFEEYPAFVAQSWVEEEKRPSDMQWYRPAEGGDQVGEEEERRIEDRKKWQHRRKQGYDFPTPAEFHSNIWGWMDLSANRIDGSCDLRNVVAEAGIRLSDTIVGLDVRMGARSTEAVLDEHIAVLDEHIAVLDEHIDEIQAKVFETRCRHIDAEKLNSGGDIDLTGLRVQEPEEESKLDRLREMGLSELLMGSVFMRGVQAKGDILFYPNEEVTGKRNEELEDFAQLDNLLDLQASTCNHLILAGVNWPDLEKREEWDRHHLLSEIEAENDQMGRRLDLERSRCGRLEVRYPPVPGPINLSRLSVDKWEFGTDQPKSQDYKRVLRVMSSFDRSTWVDVENSLRNRAQDGAANEVYEEMRWVGRWWAARRGSPDDGQGDTERAEAGLSLQGWWARIWYVLIALILLGSPLVLAFELAPRPELAIAALAGGFGMLEATVLLRRNVPESRVLYIGVFVTASATFLVLLLLELEMLSGMAGAIALGFLGGGILGWGVQDREGIYGITLGFGTRAWLPILLALPLFAYSVSIFADAGNVGASHALIEAWQDDALPGATDEDRLTELLALSPDHVDWYEWRIRDAIALSLRYQVPVVPSVTHEWWQAGQSTRVTVFDLTPEQYAFFLTLYHWVAWPLFLLWVAARVVRGRQQHGGA